MEIEDVESLVTDKTAVLLYFYNDNCPPCKILRPKVKDLVQDNFPQIEFRLINAELFPATSAQYGAFSSPTLLVFFEGKEYIRESKNISISELHDKIYRFYTMIY